VSFLVRIVLDSGTLLEDDENATSFPYVEVGTFRPHIKIYGDGELIAVIDEERLSGHQIELRPSQSDNRNEASAVTLSDELLKFHLLRLPELYGDDAQYVPVEIDAYDCVLRLSSGQIRSSMIKDRDFVEINGETQKPTGRRRRLANLAHDLVAELNLKDGESFELVEGERVLWSSSQYGIKRELQIEVVADNSTAELFYRRALRLGARENYWIPNVGDPPPTSPYRGRSERLRRAERVLENQQFWIPEIIVNRERASEATALWDLYARWDRLAGVPEKTVSERPKALDRYINLWFSALRADEPIIQSHLALIVDHVVYLRLNIGQFDSRTILEEARPFISQEEIERAFPETKGKPVPLEVALFSSDFEIGVDDGMKKVKLGAGKPTKTLYFQVTPRKLGPAHLRVCVFYKNHLLQSLGVVARVAESSKISETFQRANVETAYSADFGRVLDLPARALWLGINESPGGTHTLNLKGSDEALSRDLADKIENALIQARGVLNKVSFDLEKDDDDQPVIDEKTGQPKKIYRFDKDNFPRASDEDGRIKRFRDDLKELASVGSKLFDAAFGTGAVPIAEEKDTVLPLVDKLKKLLRTEQVIQITRFRLQDIWPWALIYDLTLDYDHVKEVCLAYRGEDGHSLPFVEGIKKCKHRNAQGVHKDKTVVCPYGFWGFRHTIEQPVWPGRKQALSDLSLSVNYPLQPVLEMLLAKELEAIEPAHVQNMKNLNFKSLETFQAVEEALNPEYTPPDPHIVYFFCHGKYDSALDPYLQIGVDDVLQPRELAEWGFRWTSPRGLVFINGCHTVDLKPKDLSVIMAPFVTASASGIIGTEITVHTHLAREFAQSFFKRLLPNGDPGQKVGAIIKDLRFELLMKYNPLGLVYTPYCSADLQFVR
jgi:hypothetical protein